MKQKKIVSFDSKVIVIKFSTKRIQEEKNRRWYSNEELRKIKHEYMKTVNIMEHNPDLIAKEECKSSKYCTRGLYTSKQKNEIKLRQYKAIDTVFEAQQQQQQQQEDHYDGDQNIAKQCAAMSMACAQRARQIALQDEEFVLKNTEEETATNVSPSSPAPLAMSSTESLSATTTATTTKSSSISLKRNKSKRTSSIHVVDDTLLLLSEDSSSCANIGGMSSSLKPTQIVGIAA